MTLEEMNKARIDRGYTYRQIAKGAGVALGTVQKVFGGTTSSPRYDTMQKLNAFFVAESSPAYNKNTSSAERVKIHRMHNNENGYSINDYLEWPEDERIELIDGVIYNMASPSSAHQIFDLAIASQIFTQIRKHGGGCVPMIAPVDVQIDSDDKTMLQPDFLIVCDKNKINEKRVVGAPDFVIEILSPSTRIKDVFIKQNKYMTSGVREYWTVDLQEKAVTVYLFTEGHVVQYSLEDTVPIGIYDGKISVDFSDISAYVSETIGESEND